MIVPSNILSLMRGAWPAVMDSGLSTADVNLRIRLTERTRDPVLLEFFQDSYPNASLLSPLTELRMDLVSSTNEVIFTVNEFLLPLSLSFPAPNYNAAHVRPVGMSIVDSRVEFVPHTVQRGQIITVNTIFPGVYGVMHNGAYFADISRTVPGFDDAQRAAHTALVLGTGNLNPQVGVTRGEFLQLMSFVLQLPREISISETFLLNYGNHNFYDGIARMSSAGLIRHWPDDNIDPDRVINQCEMFTIISFIAEHNDSVWRVMPPPTVAGAPVSRINAVMTVMDLARAMLVLD
jgi:hypothetical protein